jgi:hypothetical protein
MHYVYTLIDPRDNVPFYVGKGKNKRSHDHLRQARRGKCRNKHLEHTIKQIWKAGHEVKIEVVQTFDHEIEAFLLERDKISKAKKKALANETIEQRQIKIQRHKDGASRVDYVTINQRNADNRQQNWSEERKAEYSKTLSAAAKRAWEKRKYALK